MPKLSTAILAPVLTLCLLTGAWANRVLSRPSIADSEPYHARVKEQTEALPMYIGTWLATEAPVPPSAVQLLRPNAIVSRRYQDALSGSQVMFLLVHCKDARDLLGHWPPVCYVGQGWTRQSAVPRDWQVDQLTVAGMQYEFTASRAGRAPHLAVDNFFILPGGKICRSMDEVDTIARDPRRKRFGAAQVQVVSDGTLSERERADALALLVRAAQPVIDAIGQGVKE
jgi:Protein of unknown function (DUF3485)